MSVDTEMSRIALDAIDDEVALVDEQPVAVDSLWSTALRSLAADHRHGMTLAHPSWWSASRVAVAAGAAQAQTKDVVALPRTRLLRRAVSAASMKTTVVVEIAERVVVVTGFEVVALPFGAQMDRMAERVAGVIAGTAREASGRVLIDAPGAVAGAPTLAALIVAEMRASGTDQTVTVIDDARLMRLAQAPLSDPGEPREVPVSAPRSRARIIWTVAAVLTVVVAVPAVTRVVGRREPSTEIPATFLVEGRVALAVPADWPTQRVVAGPGSARVQVTSPSDPQVALHVTQSLVAGETLTDTAERLRRAIDAEPAGVFVDFNPSGISAGRPAVTYREVRSTHHVRWTVLLDGSVRISIGCQSRPGAEDGIRVACEQAVRSAHAVE